MKENKLQLHAMEVRREALKEHKIYIYRMPSHLKDFLGKVKPIKEYDWTGTVIKKVVILISPVFYLRLEKYIKFPATIIFGS